LLPVKAAQKKEMLKSQLIVTVLALIVTVGLCAAAMVYVNGEIDKRQAQIDAKRAEIARLAKVIREVKDFEKRQKDLRAKLDVLDRLQASRIGPLYLLDELYRAMPDKLWLTSFKENNGRAQITGVGSNEETVALFMKNLERSDLAVQDNIKLQQFDLTSATKSGKPGRNGK
ncbi:MAG: PilN domain-containing protein, partial [Desulfuromonadales bacterium]